MINIYDCGAKHCFKHMLLNVEVCLGDVYNGNTYATK